MLDLPLQCHERTIHTELRAALVLIRTPMQVTNTLACNAMFAPVSIRATGFRDVLGCLLGAVWVLPGGILGLDGSWVPQPINAFINP